ncbi:MAG: NAD-dependent epimerase/dehydratase family protein [Anaerolineae bacterium]|nr:NAD-dependent epimerase/dehydratase family protein [Anaerolineae bacterium]
MKILVTGGAGFIASHVVDLYLARGHEVVIIDDLSTGRLSNVNPSAKLIRMDIRSPQLAEVFTREHPDVVNHHAAQMDVRRSVADPFFDADVNILGSLNLIENASKHSVQHFVYISSGGAAYGEPQYLPCDENHPINPICPYGVSKHTVEHYLYLFHINYGLNYTVLRYPNVFGPRQDPHGEAGVVAIFTGRMLRGEPVRIHGDGEQVRDFVHVSDCAAANLLAVEVPHDSGIYNLGSGRGTSVNQVFDMIREATGYDQAPIHEPAKLGETRTIYLDARKAQAEFGWRPQVTMMEGIRGVVQYFHEKELTK